MQAARRGPSLSSALLRVAERAFVPPPSGGAVLVTSTAEAAAAVAHGTPADVLLARRLSVPVGAAAGIVGSVAGSGGAAVIVPLISARATSIAQRCVIS